MSEKRRKAERKISQLSKLVQLDKLENEIQEKKEEKTNKRITLMQYAGEDVNYWHQWNGIKPIRIKCKKGEKHFGLKNTEIGASR